MIDKIKQAILFLLKPKAIVLGLAIFYFFLVHDFESKKVLNTCWDCRSVGEPLLIVLSALGLVLNKWWSVMVSLLLSLLVVYFVGHIAFWNNFAEAHETWQILRVSMKWTAETHPQYFIDVVVAALMGSYSLYFLYRNISRKYLDNRTASNNSFNRTRNQLDSYLPC
jgi:hypothetical protein